MAMTDKQQAVMAAAIRQAMETQGIQQKELAMRGACTSPGNLSMCLSCKSKMSETKWRGACEMLGIDYDTILAGDAPEQEAVASSKEIFEEDKPLRPMELTLGLLLESMEASQPVSLYVKGGTLTCEAGALSRLLCCEAQCSAVNGLQINDGALEIDLRGLDL